VAVAHDFASESHTGATGSASEASFTWEHDPVADPQGVTVFVINLVDDVFDATSVTYEGVDVPEVTACRAVDSAGEPGAVQVFHLGNSALIPDVGVGTATVVVNRNNNANELWAVCCTQLSGADTAIHEAGIVKLEGDGTLAVQSVTDGSPGSDSVRYAGGHSGLAAFPPTGTGSTALHNFDTGNQTAAVVRETTAGQGSRNVGFSSGTSEDRAFVHFAVKQIVAVQNIAPSGLVHTRAFGTAKINHTLTANAPVIHTRAFGTPVLPKRGFVAWVQMQVPPEAAQAISPTGVVHSRAFGTTVVVRGAVIVAPSSVAHSRTIPSPVIVRTIHQVSVVHTRVIGTAVVVPGVVTIVETSVVHGRAFGTALLIQTIQTTSVVHTRGFGTAVVSNVVAGAQNLFPQPVVHTRAFGTAVVVRGGVSITPGGVVHTRAFGTAAINARRGLVAWAQIQAPAVLVTILPSSVIHTRAFGTAKVYSSRITPTGVVHTRAFGNTNVIGTQAVAPASVIHTRAFGTTFVGLEPRTAAAGFIWLHGDVEFGLLEVPSVIHPRAIGTARLRMLIVVPSVVHTRAFGTTLIGAYIIPFSVIHTRDFGLPQLNQNVTTSSVIHTRGFGGPTVGHGLTLIQTTSAVHGRTFGTAVVTVSVFTQFIITSSVIHTRNITGPLVTRAGDPAVKKQGAFTMEWGVDTFHPGDVEVEVTN